MRSRLLSRLSMGITVLFLCCASPFSSNAQTTLATGEIGFTGYTSDDPDEFTFIILRSGGISAGTQIIFTDNGWLSSGNSCGSGTVFNNFETAITWTASSALPYLTEVTVTGSGATSGSYTGSFLSLASGGDQIFALQGTLNGTSTILGAIQMNGAWDAASTSSSTSAKPPCLTDGTSSVSISPEIDNARLKCSVTLSATPATAQAQVNTAANWETDDVTGFTQPRGCTPTNTTWNGTTWNNGAPTSSVDAIIASSTTPGSFTCQNLTINSGVALTMGSGTTATINGNVTNNGNGFSGVGTFTFASSGALSGNAISTEGVITVSTGATLTTNSLLTLASNATNTGAIGNSAGSISGNVTVQRYIPGGRRAFRFFGHPFSSGIALSQLTDDIDITGSGGAANGFTTTQLNNPSAFWYDVSTANGSGTNDAGWTAFGNTSSTSGANGWDQYEGIRVLVRGALNEGLTGGSYTPSAVTLDMTGAVNQGSQVVNVTKGSSTIYALVANPFPSQIQMNQVTRGGGIATFYYVWDATSGVRGAYVARLYSTSYILPSGAAFVTAIASTSTLTFPESCKSTSTPGSLFKGTANQENATIGIYSNNDSIKWDMLQLYFDNTTSHDSEAYDAGKWYNPDLAFYSFSNDDKMLAIDTRPYKDGEVIKLGVAYARELHYKMKLEDFNIAPGVKLYLHDKYLNKTEEIKPGFIYEFDITSDSLSQGDNRFEINMTGKPAGIHTQVAGTASMQLAPNPARNEVRVTFSDIAGTAKVRLVNMTGQVLQVADVNTSGGSVILPLQNLPTGVYMVELIGKNAHFVEKLIKE